MLMIMYIVLFRTHNIYIHFISISAFFDLINVKIIEKMIESRNFKYFRSICLPNSFHTVTTSKLKCCKSPYQWKRWTHNTGSERPGN